MSLHNKRKQMLRDICLETFKTSWFTQVLSNAAYSREPFIIIPCPQLLFQKSYWETEAPITVYSYVRLISGESLCVLGQLCLFWILRVKFQIQEVKVVTFYKENLKMRSKRSTRKKTLKAGQKGKADHEKCSCTFYECTAH